MATLTRTQRDALADLRKTGHQWPLQPSPRMGGSNYTASCRYARKTLQALVDAGLAKWAHPSPGVLSHVVPIAPKEEPTVARNVIINPRMDVTNDDPLTKVAASWAKSKTITPVAQTIFVAMAAGRAPVGFTRAQFVNAFMQAFAASATRKSHSPSRRYDVDGLWRLWEHYDPKVKPTFAEVDAMTTAPTKTVFEQVTGLTPTHVEVHNHTDVTPDRRFMSEALLVDRTLSFVEGMLTDEQKQRLADYRKGAADAALTS